MLAFVASRVFIWLVALLAIAVVGLDLEARFNPVGTLAPRDGIGRELLAPAARWDANSFMTIARDGYASDPNLAAFFPLYPLLVRIVGTLVGVQAAGVLVSCVAAVVAFGLLHRLTELELGRRAATHAVMLLAFFPTALFLSAIYSESLFLALSVGCVLAARQRRWALAGVLGGLAAATRNGGVLLLVPLALLLLEPAPGAAGRVRRPGAEGAWLLLVPLGLCAALAYLGSAAGGLDATFEAQREGWGRTFAGPLRASWDAVDQARTSVRAILDGATVTGPAGFEAGLRNAPLELAAFLAALVATAGALRRLPLAYSAYAAAALALAASFPVDGAPLMSMTRLVLVIFPLFMWLGAWTAERGMTTRTALGATWLIGLAAETTLFATWRFIG